MSSRTKRSALGVVLCVAVLGAWGCGAPAAKPPPDAGVPEESPDAGQPLPDAGQPAFTLTVIPDPELICLDGCLNFTAGLSRLFVAIAKDDQGNELAEPPAVQWYSTDENVASVDSSGLVTTHRAGEASIMATSGTVIGEAMIHVNPARVASISVTPNPVTVAAGSTVKLTAVGYDEHGVALDDVAFGWQSSNPLAATVDEDGTVTGVSGGYVVILAGTDRAALPGWASVEVTSSEPAPVGFGLSSLSVGTYHGCGVAGSGGTYCWGWNFFGQLGVNRLDASTSNFPVPEPVQTSEQFEKVVMGGVHSCALTATGDAWCWGSNENGQLGTHATLKEVGGAVVPYPVLGGLKWKVLAPGAQHTCGIAEDDQTYCWGAGYDGALGLGDLDSRPTPTPVDASVQFTQVVTGMASSCGLATDGTPWCWGRNSEGQLGTAQAPSDSIMRQTPTKVFGSPVFTSLALTSSHVCALDSTGAAWCWGRNDSGQLGNGMTTASPIPVQVATPERFIQLAVGAHHTCGLRSDGDVFCWGSNFSAQLGDGTLQDSTSPVKVLGGHAFKSITAAGSVNCGLTMAGEALCWGSATFGESGAGTSGGFLPAPWPMAMPVVE